MQCVHHAFNIQQYREGKRVPVTMLLAELTSMHAYAPLQMLLRMQWLLMLAEARITACCTACCVPQVAWT
jgi:hypothetical protein